ncbi:MULTISPECIES: hypothetical protein [Pseudomonas]|jgi:hypothetical protein|uniref:hypothetical protein n=1 Tax=Pseudomonas TaxID=286 RepID=UPI000289D294|nr:MULTISPECIES: hypothetical protein [Pseudomonas]AMB80052.1 hypothetical protein AV641_13735 [Pseudomonas fragi]MCB1656474.1 hypothetical protein [Pseudomonadales bacterium]NBF17651.1 hypothetical protein [Pseudomonas sp. Fl4BN2]NNG62232.1 hypothetical protein [Pseudomonas sp. GC01]MCH4870313.1 hypothetical protein [Pseudomonas sp. TMW22089]
MSSGFTEDEMRRALGLDTPATPVAPPVVVKPEPVPVKPALLSPKTPTKEPVKRRGPMLRVTLQVSKEYDGEETRFVHDAKTLSRFDAEQAAKKALAKAGFKYFVVESIVQVD